MGDPDRVLLSCLRKMSEELSLFLLMGVGTEPGLGWCPQPGRRGDSGDPGWRDHDPLGCSSAVLIEKRRGVPGSGHQRASSGYRLFPVSPVPGFPPHSGLSADAGLAAGLTMCHSGLRPALLIGLF